MGERHNIFGDDEPKRPQRPKGSGPPTLIMPPAVPWKAVLTLLAVLLVFLIPVVIFDRVPPDRIGVKTDLFGEGIVQTDLDPGFHLIVPGLHKLTLVDCTLKNHLLREYPVLLSDKSTAKVDISIVYRINPVTAHKAVTVLPIPYAEGAQRLVKVKAEKSVTEILAKLEAEALYDVGKRKEQSQLVRDALHKQLESSYVLIIDVLLRNVLFPESFERELLNRQLYEQGKLLEDSKGQLQTERQKTEEYMKETEQQIATFRAETAKMERELERSANIDIAKTLADANKNAQILGARADEIWITKSSAGERALTEAKAYGEKLLNEAYGGVGGELYLTKLMIEALKIGDIEINTNQTNPFDVRQMLELLGAPEKSLSPAPRK